MDQDLKQYLDEKFAGIDDKFAAIDNKFAALDEKLGGIENKFAGIDEKFMESENRFMQRFDGRIDAFEKSLTMHVGEQFEKVGTKLLTEFQKWGRTSDMRTRQAITDVGLLGERMLAIEDRVADLERKRAS